MIRASLRKQWPGFGLDVDFASEGPVLGVFGASGSGKTSLLHALAGWIEPDEASIKLRGRTLTHVPGGVRLPIEARRVAVVPQDPLLFPHRTVRANLAFAPGAGERLRSARGQRMVEWLHLGPLLERRTDSLSGGERQRVALGRAWLADPALVLLDEPAASLDASMAREVVALLLEAKQAWGIPMVLVTHRSTELMALADDCLLLEKGRIVAQGPPIEVLRQAKAHDTESWTGVDNLLALTVLEHQPKDGLTWLDLGAGERLAAPFVDLPPGQILQIAIRGEDLLLAQLAPGPTSARNHLRGQVTRLESIGGEVLVEVLVGTTRLQARITQGAARALELARDQAVHVLIKTTACTPLWV